MKGQNTTGERWWQSLRSATVKQIALRILVSSSFASVVIAFSPNVEYTLLTFAISILYVGINSVIQYLFPGTIILDGKPAPIFRLYTSIFHGGFIAGSLLLTILSLRSCGYGNDVATWLVSGWVVLGTDDYNDDTNKYSSLVETVDMLALCITMGYELKDGMVDDFDWSLERVGIYVHHVATTGACLYIFRCTYGKGYMLFNGLQALVGSLIYCVWRLDKLNTTLYCITMTVSNMLGAWLVLSYYRLAQTNGDKAVLFPCLCAMIIVIRQYPVMEVMRNNADVTATEKRA